MDTDPFSSTDVPANDDTEDFNELQVASPFGGAVLRGSYDRVRANYKRMSGATDEQVDVFFKNVASAMYWQYQVQAAKEWHDNRAAAPQKTSGGGGGAKTATASERYVAETDRNGNKKFCEHGQKTYNEFTAASGKFIKAFFCKDNVKSCEADFIK